MVLSILQMAWDAHWGCCLEERRVVRLTAVLAWQGQASGSEHRGRGVGMAQDAGDLEGSGRHLSAAEQSPHHGCNWESRD